MLLLREQVGIDVGLDSSLADGGVVQQFVQLFVVFDGQKNVSRDDSSLLVVFGGVPGQLQNFGGQVLQHGSQIYRGTGAHSLAVSALLQVSADSANGEL